MKTIRSLACLAAAVLVAHALAAPALTWAPAAKMLVGKAGQVCGSVGGKVLVAGGFYWAEGVQHWTGDLDIYDPATEIWRRGLQMPFPLSCGTGQVVGDRLYIVSGTDGDRDYDTTIICLRVAGRYDYVRGPQLPGPRLYAASAVVGSKLIVIGGAPDSKLQGKLYSDALILDTSNPQAGWKASRKMPGSGLAPAAAVAVEGLVYVFGGTAPQAGGGLRDVSSVLIYDPERDLWRRGPKLPYALRAAAAVTVGKQALLLGGWVTWPRIMDREPGATDRVLCFDPAAGTFTDAGKLPVAVSGGMATLLPDGRFLAFGGQDQEKHCTDAAALGRF